MRKIAAWIIYWLGEASLGLSYPLYNRMMLLSSDVQGKGAGPWKDARK